MSRKPNSIPPRWLDCPRKGFPIHKFVPFKTPLDSRYDDQVPDSNKFDIDMLLMSCRGAKIDIGFIIDLTNTSRFYDKAVVESNNIRYLKLQCRGHGETPSEEQTGLFINVCDHYIRQNPLKHIGIHCAHGFNRTGFLIIAFLVEKLDWSIDAAVASFSRCRPPGIYKQDYLGELYRRYGGDIDSAPSAPALPDWCTEPEDQYDDGTPVPTSLMMGKRPISDEGERPPSKRKKEMDRKDAQFMDGKVDGVHPVNDPQVREQVQRKAQAMCRWKSSGFPGSQPVSMDRANLHKLAEKPYKVSWKADGMRYLMLIDGNRRNYMLDRDNQVFQVPNLTFPRRKDLDACIENTLVDGEMIMDVVNGNDVPRFLIYDIIKFENVDVGGADFDRRLLCINKEIIGPRHQKIQEGRLDKARETISIRIKPFWDVTYAQQLMDGKFSKQVSHETDGLIFQPAKDAYKAGRCDETLKWKPPDMNSVDFKLTITTEQQTGCLPTTKGLLWVGGYNKPFAQMKTMVGWLRSSLLRRAVQLCRAQHSMSSTSSDVLMETVGDKAVITMNRPKALNALSLPMVRQIYPQLVAWEEDAKINMVMIKGAGEKAFCAGGDIRALLDKTDEAADLRKNFFKEEYILNNAIGTLKVPYVALIDGITMGGGVGLSVHGTFRVATERTLFAMPETAIGLFPDVGGSYFLSRLGGKLGVYLALTGFRLRGHDVHRAGVATHYVSSDKIGDLEKDILSLNYPDANSIADVLNSYQKQSPVSSEFVLAEHMERINACFSGQTAEQILDLLRQDGSEWAQKQIDTLAKMSPTSVKVTLRQIAEGAEKDLQECLEMEYRLAQRFMEDHDFFEGVRAVLVDRDNKPAWKPARLQDVTDETVDHYFSPLPAEDELVL